ncbi:hypothetical protein BJ508DRAFT_343146 [Ascobolus immersus RN42]|uniref:Uncharacterized protein n=1 Tax=Ascobolus immersus RN42 TaxID=1160509 RepID=A0A3N4IG16_ASCIM|nr:hypothetical protein BJ508DRAFT_343146 [Ascobolus immersus RN42]
MQFKITAFSILAALLIADNAARASPVKPIIILGKSSSENRVSRAASSRNPPAIRDHEESKSLLPALQAAYIALGLQGAQSQLKLEAAQRALAGGNKVWNNDDDEYDEYEEIIDSLLPLTQSAGRGLQLRASDPSRNSPPHIQPASAPRPLVISQPPSASRPDNPPSQIMLHPPSISDSTRKDIADSSAMNLSPSMVQRGRQRPLILLPPKAETAQVSNPPGTISKQQSNREDQRPEKLRAKYSNKNSQYARPSGEIAWRSFKDKFEKFFESRPGVEPSNISDGLKEYIEMIWDKELRHKTAMELGENLVNRCHTQIYLGG